MKLFYSQEQSNLAKLTCFAHQLEYHEKISNQIFEYLEVPKRSKIKIKQQILRRTN